MKYWRPKRWKGPVTMKFVGRTDVLKAEMRGLTLMCEVALLFREVGEVFSGGRCEGDVNR